MASEPSEACAADADSSQATPAKPATISPRTAYFAQRETAGSEAVRGVRSLPDWAFPASQYDSMSGIRPTCDSFRTEQRPSEAGDTPQQRANRAQASQGEPGTGLQHPGG